MSTIRPFVAAATTMERALGPFRLEMTADGCKVGPTWNKGR